MHVHTKHQCNYLTYFGGETGYVLAHVDEFIDELLTTDYSCDIALPRVPKRYVHKNSHFPLLHHIVMVLVCPIREACGFSR